MQEVEQKPTVQLNIDALKSPKIMPEDLQHCLTHSWRTIAPSWPLKNLVAANPLQGLEDLPFEHALQVASQYFQQPYLPEPLLATNRESIKWCQVFFDEGQAGLTMPNKNLGLYLAWKQLACYDKHLYQKDRMLKTWLAMLPNHTLSTINLCVKRLGIPQQDLGQFFTMLLVSLPGWASLVKYHAQWALEKNQAILNDFIAFRLAILCCFTTEANTLLEWFQSNPSPSLHDKIKSLQKNEQQYQQQVVSKLLSGLKRQSSIKTNKIKAQFVFCIDVRSEPFRRALEQAGPYETFSMAGFFAVPLQVNHALSGEQQTSCPVLLSPTEQLVESSAGYHEQFGYQWQCLWGSLKNTIATPFALVETVGILIGLWMLLMTAAPRMAGFLKNKFFKKNSEYLRPHESDIPFERQCEYAHAALASMGLTNEFSPIVVLCGHGSETQNNSYAAGLNCGACGGRHGASNARILSAILNNKAVRHHLATREISIPEQTQFVAAHHNTTTDDLTLLEPLINTACTDELQHALQQAKQSCCQQRAIMSHQPRIAKNQHLATQQAKQRSENWAEVRPEWGLARNASFIVGPRWLTQSDNFEGRAFLHSYEWQQDPQGDRLRTILTAPMIVAQWINCQYLFSTLDNKTFGAGSKITQNITGKLGAMQGNASDLMHGLPLQSVYQDDGTSFHQAQRLLTVVYAPRGQVEQIIHSENQLEMLFKNQWLSLICIDPQSEQAYQLNAKLDWEKRI